MKKALLAAGAVTAIAASTLVGVGVVSAQSSTNSTNGNPMSNLVDAIASKFSLNKDEVQAVFDEQHTKMEADRTAEVKTELDTLVKDGKLTQEQVDAILAKRDELQKQRDALRANGSDNRDDRRAAMDKERSDLDAWAKEKNIPAEYLRYVFGGGKGGQRGEGRGNRSSDDQGQHTAGQQGSANSQSN